MRFDVKDIATGTKFGQYDSLHRAKSAAEFIGDCVVVPSPIPVVVELRNVESVIEDILRNPIQHYRLSRWTMTGFNDPEDDIVESCLSKEEAVQWLISMCEDVKGGRFDFNPDWHSRYHIDLYRDDWTISDPASWNAAGYTLEETAAEVQAMPQ